MPRPSFSINIESKIPHAGVLVDLEMVCTTPRFPRDVPLNGSISVFEDAPTNAFGQISVSCDQESGTAESAKTLLGLKVPYGIRCRQIRLHCFAASCRHFKDAFFAQHRRPWKS
jgi:hypothetical protein